MSIRRPFQMLGVLAIAVMAMAAAGSAQAVSIAITNPSFEDDVLGDGLFTNNALSGWTITASCGGSHCAGAVNPTTANYPTTPGDVPDGSNAAYTNGGSGGMISQILGTSVIAGTTYTLDYEVGNRIQGGPAFAAYTVELLAGGTSLASSSTTASGATPALGTWESGQIVYVAQPGDAGLLEIKITGTGQGQFDHFRLDATPAIPEPSAALAFAAGLAVIGSALRRRS